ARPPRLRGRDPRRGRRHGERAAHGTVRPAGRAAVAGRSRGPSGAPRTTVGAAGCAAGGLRHLDWRGGTRTFEGYEGAAPAAPTGRVRTGRPYGGGSRARTPPLSHLYQHVALTREGEDEYNLTRS